MNEIRIQLGDIVDALPEVEFNALCGKYKVGFQTPRLRNRQLLKELTKEFKGDNIDAERFIAKFHKILSPDTMRRIFPGIENFLREHHEEKVYRDYYNAPNKPEPAKVSSIDFLAQERRRTQQDEAIMRYLIEKRKKDETLNKLRIHSSPFQDRINSIKATIEKQLTRLKELEARDKLWKEQHEKPEEEEQPEQPKQPEPKEKPEPQPQPEPKEEDPITEPTKRIEKAISQPLDTIIELDNLTDEEKNEMGLLLKAFYEEHIKSLDLSQKILVEYYVNGEWITRPLDKKEVKEQLEKMLDGNYVFSCDELKTVGSDVETEIHLSFIDAIRFRALTHEKLMNERKRRPSAFFPKRLKPEFKWFKTFLRPLAIGCNLYSTKHRGPKKWVKYCCLVYAIQQAYPEQTTLLEEVNRKLDSNRYISSDKLTEIGNIFSIQFTLRSKDNKEGMTKKGNKANNGIYGPKEAKYKVDLARYNNHYFLYQILPISTFFIKHYSEIIKNNPIRDQEDFLERCQIYEKRSNGSWKINTAKAHISSLDLVILLDELGWFEPLHRDDRDVDLACVHEWATEKVTCDNLTIQPYNIKPLEPPTSKWNPLEKKNNRKPVDENLIYYADFETCTKDDQEFPFMVCVQSRDGKIKETFKGFNCAEDLMNFLPQGATVYFHNLGFDGRLLMKYSIQSNIMKGSKIITQKHNYEGKKITFKDSYSIFPQALKTFPASFKKEFAGLNIQKELFPYRYYSYNRLEQTNTGTISEVGNYEIPLWTPEQRKQFKENIEGIPSCKLDEDHFDMMLYCEFYCQQDVNLLRIGFNAFREAALKKPIEMDIFELTTAPALANEYLNRNVFYPNSNLYTYSGKLQDYIMGAVYGGRCMAKQNKRWLVNDKILDDFDACSLYPSAMARLFEVEGKPRKIKPEIFKDEIYDESHPCYLLKHAFEENQTEPTKEKFISYFIVDIEITSVGIKRDFPLIVNRDEKTKTNMNTNEPTSLRVDLIMLEDLVRFQKITYKVKGGLAWTTQRTHRIREVIKQLFEQRAQYKKEGNSVQQVIKLIMNSGYGKSIQRPIKTDIKFIPESKFNHFACEHYHQINMIKKIPDSDTWMFELNKQIEKQFNNCVFGVSVLSMSKRIMNEVMCLAEDLEIQIYYQDTDSMHIEHSKLETLANEFKKKYSRELIGENIMGRFHNDFDELPDAYCVFHVSLGKKMYYDELKNDKGEHAEHFRMKGIPNDVIVDFAKRRFKGSVKDLYMHLYNGGTIQFNLTESKVRFQMEKTGEILHKNEFLRKVKATAPKA